MPQPAKRTLYLDFDGVLHPDNAYIDNRGRVRLEGPGALFMWAPTLAQALEDHPDIDIVLSTSWVPTKSFSYARKSLPADLAVRVTGATWHSSFRHDYDKKVWWDHSTRCEQILADVNRRGRAGWLAIDDDHADWVPAFTEHLVRTHGDTGLGSPWVRERLRGALCDLSAGRLDRRADTSRLPRAFPSL